MTRGGARLSIAAILLLAACRSEPETPPLPPTPIDRAKTLLSEGRFDDALGALATEPVGARDRLGGGRGNPDWWRAVALTELERFDEAREAIARLVPPEGLAELDPKAIVPPDRDRDWGRPSPCCLANEVLRREGRIEDALVLEGRCRCRTDERLPRPDDSFEAWLAVSRGTGVPVIETLEALGYRERAAELIVRHQELCRSPGRWDETCVGIDVAERRIGKPREVPAWLRERTWEESDARPSRRDRDGDGLPDAVETNYALDPRSKDTDGDGIDDGEDRDPRRSLTPDADAIRSLLAAIPLPGTPENMRGLGSVRLVISDEAFSPREDETWVVLSDTERETFCPYSDCMDALYLAITFDPARLRAHVTASGDYSSAIFVARRADAAGPWEVTQTGAGIE